MLVLGLIYVVLFCLSLVRFQKAVRQVRGNTGIMKTDSKRDSSKVKGS